MRSLALVLAILGCGPKGGTPAGAQDDITYHTPMADDEPAPSYDKAEIQKVLTAERGLEAAAERSIGEIEAGGDSDQLRVAFYDLAVRRRFIASLEVCEAMGRYCPPRLDDPPHPADTDADPKLDTPLRFDLESWKKLAAELHGRACACRTLACVDSIDAAIARLETRPMPEVQSDDTASLSVVRARDCLFRLRGKRPLPRLAKD